MSAVEKGGEPDGTRRFGFEWVCRPASKGGVITGFREKAIARFSSRRAQITKTTLALADQYEKDRGHAPDQRALASMRWFANAMTRRAKEPGALNFTALLRGWDRASRVAELETLRDLARTIWHAAPRASAPTEARGDTRAEPVQTAMRLAPRGERHAGARPTAMATGLAQAQESRAGWSRPDPDHWIYRAHGGERYATRATAYGGATARRHAIRRPALSRARPGRCAARRGPWATTDAATRGCGWRLDGRSG